ncbi:MAG TPA: ribose 5-phosphate isomerase B [Candidatus Latescibacteria bacterium]|nr:ribose 5-phosphate isomerase B [Candidatus Latescibacterota bacterium]
MRLAIGADHGGFKLKERIKRYLDSVGKRYKDFGAYQLDSTDDYPDYGFKVAEAVAEGEFDRGILVCGTGIGMSVVANKVKGIVAALCNSVETAQISRTHNNANVLVLGGRVTAEEEAIRIVGTWLKAEFAGGRHRRRTEKIFEYERIRDESLQWKGDRE